MEEKIVARSPAAPDGDRPPRRSWRARLARGFHTCVHNLWSVCLLFALLLAYLWAFGFPARLSAYFIDKLNRDDFVVSARRVRLDPLAGLIFDELRMDGPAPLGTNFVSARTAVVRPAWRRLLRRDPGGTAVSLHGGELRWPYAEAVPSGAPGRLDLRQVTISLLLETNVVRVLEAGGQALGFHLAARGDIARPPLTNRQAISWRWLSHLAGASRAVPDWLVRARREVETARFSSPPRLQVDFTSRAAFGEPARVALRAEGGRSFVRGGVVDSWRAEASYDGRTLSVTNLALRSERGGLTGSGELGLASRRLSFSVASDLPSAHALRILPDRWARALKERGVRVLGSLRVEAAVTNVPMDQVADRICGSLWLENLEWRDLPIDRARADFARDGAWLRLSGIEGQIGGGRAGGPLRGRYDQQMRTGEFSGDFDGSFMPLQARSLLPPGLLRVLDNLAFLRRPPRVALHFSGAVGGTNTLALDGRMEAADFVYNGVTATTFATRFAYTNRVVTFHDWDLLRPEGALRGHLELDLGHKLFTVAMDSRLRGDAVKRLIGHSFEKTMRFARFEGPAHITALGTVDVGPGQLTDLRVRIDAQNAGVEWFLADDLGLDVQVDGHDYRFTNVVARAYGGEISGAGVLHLAPGDSHPPYALSAVATGVSLARLVRALKPDSQHPYDGELSGDVELSGRFGSGQGTNVTGSGHLAIVRGKLFRIPLFGGLSRLLSAVIPGLGFSEQTDFRATVKFAKGRCETRDAMFEGGVLSVRAQGAYFFNQKLRFVVEVKPLRRGGLAAVVRFVTFPLTRLLAFDLTGTVSDPKWRPSNLPKEVFLIFD